MTLLGTDRLLAPLREALSNVPADEADIHVHRRRAAITRYSHSSIHQNAVSDETHATVRAIVGQAVGIVTTNSLAPSDLRRALGDAASLARASRPDTEWPGVADPEPIAATSSFHDETAATSAEAQAEWIGAVCAAVPSGMRAAGTSQIEVTEDAVANTRGVAAYAPATMAYLRALVLSDTYVGSGYAEELSMRSDALHPEVIAARAAEKCALDRDRAQLEPGDYEAVFEELAVAEVLRIMSLTGLGGQTVREGRSFMAGRMGERVTGENFTLLDHATDARTIAVPFDVEGTPKQKVTKAMGKRSTGHAADPSRYAAGGHAGHLAMAGGPATREQLIGAVQRGILITRFHYTNTPDPRAATMTGTTRDGTFLIEDGKIARALANVRYTMSALDLFSGIDLLGPQRLARDWWSSNGMGSVICLVPPIKVRRATITGSSPL